MDWAIWGGVPFSLLMTAAFTTWWIWHLRHQRSPEAVLCLAAVATLQLHTMLELPHMLAYFLLPASVLMGVLSAEGEVKAVFQLPRAIPIVLSLALIGLLSEIFIEYQRLETNLMAARVRAARIAGAPEEYDPHVPLIGWLQDVLLTIRMKPQRGMQDAQLDKAQRTLIRFPAFSGLMRLGQAAALNGRPQQAQWALEVGCNLHAKDDCDAARRAWITLTESQFPEMAEIPFPSTR
ncbi:Wzy polymerase domain-containing protein [Ideonella sp. B508-1]|uniref:Wzy polymerase domain-containing protein n=1 Tax=Ideonella sp. B508-1 TaxID=137716 RepID=UPI00131F1475|nr:Wzy polymerase domain-containing protein [Ideonella sp. B508-1]